MLEEPLDISTKVFRKWAEQSDPFSYVGCHWTDLYIAYFKVKPVSLYAVGQKVKLRNEYAMDAYDAPFDAALVRDLALARNVQVVAWLALFAERDPSLTPRVARRLAKLEEQLR